MIQRRYHIRAGAKTTAGGTVTASTTWFRIDGVSVACEGDPVDCPTCGTQGFIQCVMPRNPERPNGKEVALSDDMCICSCSPPPRLIAEQTIKCQIFLVADEPSIDSAKEAATSSPLHDEQPQLIAASIEGMPYFIETFDGRTFSGRAGPGGLLPRIATQGEGEYHVYWGDEALIRMTAGLQNE